MSFMIIRSLELMDYRNYEKAGVDFSEKINIFYGNNAQGKTNILEAIYLAGTTKSHRGTKDREIIRFDQNEAHIKMMVERNESPYRIDMHLKKNKNKGIAVNGIPIRRASELFGIVNVVFFSPEDLQIIKNGPGERRRFIDSELCQLDRVYLNDIVNYNKILQQRNQLLRDRRNIEDAENLLDVYDSQLVKFGKSIICLRERFLKELDGLIRDIHRNLSGKKEELKVIYEKNVDGQDFEDELFRSRERDFRTSMTNVGPHRDDICFSVNDGEKTIDLRKFGSQGQQRTAAMSLKLAEIDLVKIKTGESPVLLLDDVLSELDSTRQTSLLDSISDVQTFITCTGLDDFVNNRFHMDKIFYVEKGTITLKNC